MCVCVRTCVSVICRLIYCAHLHKDQPLIRSKLQAVAYERKCVCVHMCSAGDRGVFVAFNPGQWHRKRETKRVLFELMKGKPFTLLHKSPRVINFLFLSEWNKTKENKILNLLHASYFFFFILFCQSHNPGQKKAIQSKTQN